MQVRIIVLVLGAAVAIAHADAQTRRESDVRYGSYVMPALAGAAAGFTATMVVAGIDHRGRGCPERNADCFDLSFLIYGAVAYLVSVPTGIVGTTLAGRDKLRIASFTLVGQAATIGGLYYLLDGPARSSQFVSAVAFVYVLGTPLISALYAYAIDRAYVRRKAQYSFHPVVAPGPGGVTYGLSLRF